MYKKKLVSEYRIIAELAPGHCGQIGYPIDEYINTHNECGYTPFLGCEKYDFPELFKENGSKFVMNKEDIIELLDIVKASKIPFLKIDFINVKKGIAKLLVSDVSLNTYKKDGLNLTIPHCHKVNLEPDFFEGDHEEDEEDGEKRYRFTIPINAK